MYISFSNKVYQEIDTLVNGLLKKSEWLHKPLCKNKLGLYFFNQYHYFTGAAHHTRQALETSQRYNYQVMAPVFSRCDNLSTALEKEALSDIELLGLQNKIIEQYKVVQSLPVLIKFLNQISSVDPESFLIYQYLAKDFDQKVSMDWKEFTTKINPHITTIFSLSAPYANNSRAEFMAGLDFIGRAIKKSSRERVMENLGLASIKIHNYLLDLWEFKLHVQQELNA